VANFKGKITSPTTVTLDAPVTVGQINFDNANAYTIAGTTTNLLKLCAAIAPATINLVSGNHTISAPMSIQSNTNMAAGSNTLTLTGAQTWASSVTLTVQSGTLTYQVSSGATIVGTNSKLVIAPAATVNARGNVDPFTQGTKYVDIENNSATGLKIVSGNKAVGAITGTGKTTVGAGAQLSASYIMQDTLVLQGTGPGDAATVIIRATAGGTGNGAMGDTSPGADGSSAFDYLPADNMDVTSSDLSPGAGLPLLGGAAGLVPATGGDCNQVPEPGTLLLLAVGALCLAGCTRRKTGRTGR
jgi:hypothetical protein